MSGNKPDNSPSEGIEWMWFMDKVKQPEVLWSVSCLLYRQIEQ
jgi:hypothetical protein